MDLLQSSWFPMSRVPGLEPVSVCLVWFLFCSVLRGFCLIAQASLTLVILLLQLPDAGLTCLRNSTELWGLCSSSCPTSLLPSPLPSLSNSFAQLPFRELFCHSCGVAGDTSYKASVVSPSPQHWSLVFMGRGLRAVGSCPVSVVDRGRPGI